MKPYDTLILLYSLKALLEKGNYDTAIELINKITEVIEKD